MNGPLSMYTLKPLVHFSEGLELSETMYKLKNIYRSKFSTTEVKQEVHTLPDVLEQRPDSDVEDLKKRQEAILVQLTYLKEQMLSLRQELENKNQTSCSPRQTDVTSNTTISKPNKPVKVEPSWDKEIVLHANPQWPPYSLLAISQLWPSILRLQLKCYTHSSVCDLPPLLTPFSNLADTTCPSPNLNIRLIWKQMGPDCELIISPVSHCPILGEANFLRYLHRTINGASDPVTEGKLDSLLDLCHCLNHTRTVRDKQTAVRSLNKHLGKSAWFGGDSMTIADLAAWSAIQSLSGVELTQNMTKWQARVSAAFGV